MSTSVSGPEVSREAQQHPHWVHVARVCNSQCFHTSNRLRDFLLYVSDCALRNAREEATEQHIGIHVFGRMPGYNSSEDSIVRTHARLLRQKLGDYYGQEGANDDVVIEIPKGHYLPAFRSRQSSLIVQTVEPARDLPRLPDPGTASLATAGGRRTGSRLAIGIAALALCAAVAIAGVAFHAGRGPLERLWAPFLADDGSLVIYSNAIFTGDSKTGLRYAVPGEVQTGPVADNFVETYTGIGELASVYDLTRLFDEHHAHFLLKRSMLVTWDEARGNNLIFIGSTAENPSLRVLPSTHDFTMMNGDGYAGFVNHQPKPGEPALYTRPEHPLTKDYAIIALMPGLQPGRKMLVFSGLTTFGTQAAVEFACHRDTAEQLVDAARAPNGEIRPFEALLETSIGGGVPLQTRLISLHLH
jgi:hypothetical protein